MDFFTVFLWVITIIAFVVSIIKNKEKTLSSMKMAKGMMSKMIGQIIGIMFLIGLMLTIIPPETITKSLEELNMFLSTVLSALVGSITLIPAFVAFPLVGSIVDIGASIAPAVAFLTTLTMVGIVTFPLEKQEFGLRFAVVRNVASFVFAIVISLIMGVLI